MEHVKIESKNGFQIELSLIGTEINFKWLQKLFFE